MSGLVSGFGGEVPEAELDELHRAMRLWMDEVEEALQGHDSGAPWKREPAPPVFGHPGHGPFALLNEASIAAAVIDRSGRLCAATPAFSRGDGEALLGADLRTRVVGARTAQLELVGTGDQSGTIALAYAPASLASHWRLPSSIHETAAALPDAVLLLSTMVGDRVKPLQAACAAFRLTDLQSRVAIETIHTGGIKQAAQSIGVSYQTAREALAEAMRRVGAQRLPELVTRLTTLAFGVLPGRANSAALLTDLWGLSERQVAISVLVAEGLTRSQAAQSLGLGEAVARKELETAYAVLGVGSAAALARRIVEARAFAWLTQATGGGFGALDEGAEPLRIAIRPDGSRVAWSDYGPASGKPVLVIHSSMTTRVVSRRLVRALHAAGYRPIAIDRPGFGLSDMPAGAGTHEPWRAAADDVVLVLDQLKLKFVDVISRGAAQFVATLNALMRERLGRIVVVNPGPPYRYSGEGKGPFALIKTAFLRNPATIAVFAPYLAGLLTHGRLARILEQWMRGSVPDHRAAQDPEIINDLYRSLRMFAAGRFEGFIAEQAAITADVGRNAIAGATNWRVILGTSDVLYDPDMVIDYWRALLPDARFQVVEDGGRFLAMTHAALVVETLAAD